MPQDYIDISERVAKTLKVYTVQTKSSMHAQSLGRDYGLFWRRD